MKDEPNPVPPPDSSNSNATSSSNSNADNAQPPPPPLPSVPSPAPARVFSPSHSSRMPPEFSSPGLPPPQPSSLNVSPPPAPARVFSPSHSSRMPPEFSSPGLPPPPPSSLNVSPPPERIKPQPKSLEPTYEEKERNQPDQTVELNGQQVKVKPKLWQKDTLGKKDASGQFTETDPEFNARQDVDKTRYFSDAEREQRKVTFTPISPEQQRQAEQANLSGNQLPPNFQPKPNVSLHHMETKRVPTPEGQMKIDAAEKAAKEAKAQQEEAEIRAARLRTEEKRRNRFVPRPQSQTPPLSPAPTAFPSPTDIANPSKTGYNNSNAPAPQPFSSLSSNQGSSMDPANDPLSFAQNVAPSIPRRGQRGSLFSSPVPDPLSSLNVPSPSPAPTPDNGMWKQEPETSLNDIANPSKTGYNNSNAPAPQSFSSLSSNQGSSMDPANDPLSFAQNVAPSIPRRGQRGSLFSSPVPDPLSSLNVPSPSPSPAPSGFSHGNQPSSLLSGLGGSPPSSLNVPPAIPGINASFPAPIPPPAIPPPPGAQPFVLDDADMMDVTVPKPLEANTLNPFVIAPDGQVFAENQADMHQLIDHTSVNATTHHSSFLSGAEVGGAGELKVDARGQLKEFTDRSGHYKPESEHTVDTLLELEGRGVDLDRVKFTRDRSTPGTTDNQVTGMANEFLQGANATENPVNNPWRGAAAQPPPGTGHLKKDISLHQYRESNLPEVPMSPLGQADVEPKEEPDIEKTIKENHLNRQSEDFTPVRHPDKKPYDQKAADSVRAKLAARPRNTNADDQFIARQNVQREMGEVVPGVQRNRLLQQGKLLDTDPSVDESPAVRPSTVRDNVRIKRQEKQNNSSNSNSLV